MMVRGELVPAVVAVTGGGAMLGGIYLHEYRREREMRASRQSYRVVFPVGVQPAAAEAALSALTGLGYVYELVTEVVGDERGVHHRLHIPARVVASVIDQMSAALPGVRLDPVEARPTGDVTAALRITVPVRAVLRSEEPVEASRALLAGMGALRQGERVSLRLALRPGRAPEVVEPDKAPTSTAARVELQAVRARSGKPGFAVSGLLLVRAKTIPRAKGLVGQVAAVLRARRGPGLGLMMRPARVSSGAVMPGTGRRRGWLSTGELVGLLGWPLGDEAIPGVELGAARRICVPRSVSREGRSLFVSRDPHGQRAVALSPEAACRHLAVLGATGGGKSTLLARAIVSDMEAGFGGILIDPKADLATVVLNHVPPRHLDRVVVLDPAQPGPVPGLNLLSVGDPDLRTDVLLSALKNIFRDSWGIRTDTFLALGLRTVNALPEAALTDWLRLFTDTQFRHIAVGHLDDPVLRMAWASFEALSPAEQQQHVAAPMSRVMSLLSRPAVRAVLAQPRPRLDIAKLLEERRWLVASLAPGLLGEATVRLLGAVLTYAVWAAVEARAGVAPAQRHPVFLYLDELQSVAALPFALETFLERSRGLGCGVTVAAQTLGRLPEAVSKALLGNVGSLVAFRMGHDEAARVSRELPGLTAQDLQSLRAFEVAARISVGGGSEAVVATGQTEPLGAGWGLAGEIRRRSAERYGQEPSVVEAALVKPEGRGDFEADAVGRRKNA